MKFNDYRKTTYKICIRFCNYSWSTKNLYQLKCVLHKWLECKRDGELEDYGYDGDVLNHLMYCSDRMNMGRAKALLRLLDEQY